MSVKISVILNIAIIIAFINNRYFYHRKQPYNRQSHCEMASIYRLTLLSSMLKFPIFNDGRLGEAAIASPRENMR